MALDISCPACGEADELRGEQRDGVIALVCEVCDAEWIRDPNARPDCALSTGMMDLPSTAGSG